MGSASLQELCGLVGSLCPLSPLRAEEPTRLRRTKDLEHTLARSIPLFTQTNHILSNHPIQHINQPNNQSSDKQSTFLRLTIRFRANHPYKSSNQLVHPETNPTQTGYLNNGQIILISSSFTLSQRHHPQSFVPIIPGIHHPLLNWMPSNAM